MAFQAQHGSVQEALDAAGCVALEPALRTIAPRLVGGIHTPGEEAADCRRFCLNLSDVLRERYGVRFAWGTPVRQLVAQGGRLRARDDPGRRGGSGRLRARRRRRRARADAPALGLRLPLYPLKGYSLSLPDRRRGRRAARQRHGRGAQGGVRAHRPRAAGGRHGRPGGPRRAHRPGAAGPAGAGSPRRLSPGGAVGPPRPLGRACAPRRPPAPPSSARRPACPT